MRKIFFSVIVPTYNRKTFVIKCVQSLLEQKFPKDKYEIIVIDNNSTDGTRQALKNYSINLLLEKKRSGDAARNKGIKKAKGKWLVFTDSDCVASKNWLSLLFKETDSPQTGCLAGKIIHQKVNSSVDDIMKKTKTINQKKALSHPHFPFVLLANATYRKEVFEKIGLIDDNLGPSGDIDLTWRMLSETNWKIKYLPRAIVYHQPRKTLRPFMGQIRFYGYGERLIEKKHKLPSNTLPRIKRTVGYFLLIIPCFFSYFFLRIIGKKPAFSPSIALLKFFYNATYLLGRFIPKF